MSFALAKILWLFAAPGNLFVLLLLPSAFMASSANRKRRAVGQRFTAFLALLALFVAVFPVGDWLLLPLENRFPAQMPSEGVDGIIMLAGDEDGALTEKRQTPVVGASAPRYIAFAALARQYPGAQLAFIGGTNAMNPASPVTNGVIAKEVLSGLGLPADRIIYEDKSRNTYENAVFGASLVKPGPERKWLLVTSAYHMPRALATFRKAGWNVFPAPADYWTTGEFRFMPSFEFSRHLRALNMAVHEYAGLAAYYLMGRL